MHKPCGSLIDCFAHAPDFVGGGIVQDDHGAQSQSGSRALLHPGQNISPFMLLSSNQGAQGPSARMPEIKVLIG